MAVITTVIQPVSSNVAMAGKA